MGVSLHAVLDHMANRMWAESFHFPKCNNTLGAEWGGAWAGGGAPPSLPTLSSLATAWPGFRAPLGLGGGLGVGSESHLGQAHPH